MRSHILLCPDISTLPGISTLPDTSTVPDISTLPPRVSHPGACVSRVSSHAIEPPIDPRNLPKLRLSSSSDDSGVASDDWGGRGGRSGEAWA